MARRSLEALPVAGLDFAADPKCRDSDDYEALRALVRTEADWRDLRKGAYAEIALASEVERQAALERGWRDERQSGRPPSAISRRRVRCAA